MLDSHTCYLSERMENFMMVVAESFLEFGDRTDENYTVIARRH